MTALRPKTARGVFPIKVFCIGVSGVLGTAVDAGGLMHPFALGEDVSPMQKPQLYLGSRMLLLGFPFVRPSP